MYEPRAQFFTRRAFLVLSVVLWFFAAGSNAVWAQGKGAAAAAKPQLTLEDIFREAGAIGIATSVLSVAMVALIIETLFTIRRGVLVPPALVEQAHQLVHERQIPQAEALCRDSPSLLGQMLAAGLADAAAGYARVEKSMEDVCARQAARFTRRIEYLAVIGTIAPMLGLLGTVWGVMLAFLEFTGKANVQVTELAPGIAHALVNTFIGLCVAIPAFMSYGWLRNRIDEAVALAAEAAEFVLADLRRQRAGRRHRPQGAAARPAERADQARPTFPSVTIDRGKTG